MTAFSAVITLVSGIYTGVFIREHCRWVSLGGFWAFSLSALEINKFKPCLDECRVGTYEQVSSLYLARSGAGKCVFVRQTKLIAVELLFEALLLECFPLPFLLLEGYEDAA